MKRLVIVLTGTAPGGCALSTEGVSVARPPAAVQDSSDAQGAPLSVPGSGI